MIYFIAIDDTDEIGTKGTGEIAEEIAKLLEENNLGQASRVTRHQLFVHDDIPYTSHNSSMCFIFDLDNHNNYDLMVELCENHLRQECAQTSDPGLCICPDEHLSDEIVEFAKQAKIAVKTKESAYQLAEKHKLFLNEYGGTGDGVIGALSGIGLRHFGFDGRFKGKHKIENGRYSIDEILKHLSVEAVMVHETHEFLYEADVELTGKIKSILYNHMEVLLVTQDDGYKNCTKEQLRVY